MEQLLEKRFSRARILCFLNYKENIKSSNILEIKKSVLAYSSITKNYFEQKFLIFLPENPSDFQNFRKNWNCPFDTKNRDFSSLKSPWMRETNSFLAGLWFVSYDEQNKNSFSSQIENGELFLLSIKENVYELECFLSGKESSIVDSEDGKRKFVQIQTDLSCFLRFLLTLYICRKKQLFFCFKLLDFPFSDLMVLRSIFDLDQKIDESLLDLEILSKILKKIESKLK